jgi:hypothetical protein
MSPSKKFTERAGLWENLAQVFPALHLELFFNTFSYDDILPF